MGYDKLYNSKNPFEFMELISIDGKTNFFDKKVTEYRKANIGSTEEEKSFSLDDEF